MEFCNKQSFFKGLLTLREHLRVPPKGGVEGGMVQAADVTLQITMAGGVYAALYFVWILCTSRTCQVPGSGARDKEIRKYPQTSPPLEDARDDIVIEVYVCVVWMLFGGGWGSTSIQSFPSTSPPSAVSGVEVSHLSPTAHL